MRPALARAAEALRLFTQFALYQDTKRTLSAFWSLVSATPLYCSLRVTSCWQRSSAGAAVAATVRNNPAHRTGRSKVELRIMNASSCWEQSAPRKRRARAALENLGGSG